MSLVVLVLIALGNGVALLLDIAAVLIVVRALRSWRPVPLLVEFDNAGRPLVDRTLRTVTRLWGRIVPQRPLTGGRQLVAAWLAVSAVRLGVGGFLAVLSGVT